MYTDFAYVYDRLMEDVDYSYWADHIVLLFERFDIKPELVLDLGCGTGSLCLELAKKGYDMIGVDGSEDMLSVAADKAAEKQVLFLNQDITSFELYGTVGAIVSTLDCFNYVTDPKGLKKVFKLAANYLDPGGLLIFDVHSRYKMEKVFGNNVFHEIKDDTAYIWQCSYDGRRKICQHDLTFFVEKEDGAYERFEEFHEERFYSKEELETWATEAGLQVLEVFDGLNFRKPTPKSERWLFVCRK